MRLNGKKTLFAAAIVFAAVGLQGAKDPDANRWERQARNVTIIRDDWGIAHVYGKTDADAVFGALYAQAEDDFNRVETSYINGMGRLAEAEGESRIYQDLRMKLFIDPEVLKAEYAGSPAWLKDLMNAFAGGLNYYLLKHPEVKPRVIKRFEPWMALSFTEGSIGGDIETINLNQLQAFYGNTPGNQPLGRGGDGAPAEEEPRGSNGFAIAPANTATRHALLLINPHTSFYFRSELQMVSEQGLNAYGASTWGQFFVYQGFNERCGWMHTSSGVDAVDEYLETVAPRGAGYVYKYGNEDRAVTVKTIAIAYKTPGGTANRKFVTYSTHHGPVVRELNGKWVTVRLMQERVKALTQAFLRTKAQDYKTFRQSMELKANSSNNTVFADSSGNIAYFHGNFIPRRDASIDWTRPVDGSNPASEWKGLLDVDETPHLLNPASGWIYNSNDWPWAAAGPSSPKKEDYPAYVEKGGQTARGRHALRVLQGRGDFSLDGLIAAAYDGYLTWFDKPIPALIQAWDGAQADHPLKANLAAQVALLRAWDRRWGVDSVPTALAIFWGEEMRRRMTPRAGVSIEDAIAQAPAEQLLEALAAASARLQADVGTWKTPWGDINRFQRLNDDLSPSFDDKGPSIPVGFPSSQWGSLASFGARAYPGTKKWYGSSGNSFVAVVEFGERVRAKAVTAGGESGDPRSRHFNDEAQRYATGALRDVYYYRQQLKGHTERTYHPGE